MTGGHFSPMMIPLDRLGYQTNYKPREASKQSTQKLPKIVTTRDSLSLGHYTGTDKEQLSQNLHRMNQKMKVEVTYNKDRTDES